MSTAQIRDQLRKQRDELAKLAQARALERKRNEYKAIHG